MRRFQLFLHFTTIGVGCFLGPALAAQSPASPLRLGERTRVTLSDSAASRASGPVRFSGVVTGLPGEALILRLDGVGHERVIPLGEVGRLERSGGIHARTGRGALRGLLLGAGTGAVTGIVLCQVSSGCHDNQSGSLFDGDNTGLVALVLGVGGALVGTGVGALVGGLSRAERWHIVPLVSQAGGSRNLGGGVMVRLHLPIA